MKRLSVLSLLLATLFAAEASPLWMRYPAISPDGRTVAFTYKGSIYTVPAAGGEARRLTSDEIGRASCRERVLSHV